MKYPFAEMVRPIIKTTLLLASVFACEQVLAAGTAANTQIKNSATVSYKAGGNTTSSLSNETIITVQELVNASLVIQQTGDVIVNSPDAEAPIKLVLTNIGNGDEAFTLGQINVSGSDDFDVTTGSFYIDDGDGVFEPGSGGDALYSDTTPPSLAPDASITIWAVSAIPDALADNSTSDVVITALSKTFSDAGQNNPQPGSFIAAAGTGGTNAVSGAPGAKQQQTATYRVSAIAVAINKSVTAVRDMIDTNNPGTQYVPGAEVDYRITVSVTGTGTATDIVVTDELPDELLLKGTTNGEIWVNGVKESARPSSQDSDGSYYDANTNTITVELSPLDSGDSVNIDFTTIIQ